MRGISVRIFFKRHSISLSAVMCMAALGAFMAAPHSARALDYLSSIGDVPLAEGLVELPEAGFVFDKPEGRIVQLTALRNADITQDALMGFYKTSLPNLGWQARAAQAGILTFERRSEILRVTFTADLVIFDLTPQ